MKKVQMPEGVSDTSRRHPRTLAEVDPVLIGKWWEDALRPTWKDRVIDALWWGVAVVALGVMVLLWVAIDAA
jgi:hypothetical protein